MIEIKFYKLLKGAFGPLEINIQVNIDKNELITFFGPSGAGKTSLLRMISGLETPDRGKIVVGETIWFCSDRQINLTPQQRRVGFVFQDYALFSHMTVRENIEFALIDGQTKETVNQLIGIMELSELVDIKPVMLSGGQQQRVALARALVQQPQLLLLDEPLSALDSAMRLKLQEYLKQAHMEYEMTTFLVSHDVSEIVYLSNKVFVLENGKIVRTGSPKDIFKVKNLNRVIEQVGQVVHIEDLKDEFELTVAIGSELVKFTIGMVQGIDIKKGDYMMLPK